MDGDMARKKENPNPLPSSLLINDSKIEKISNEKKENGISSIFSSLSFIPLHISCLSSSFLSSSSSSCSSGGVFSFSFINKGERFEMKECNVTECSCSSTDGEGGGIYFTSVQPSLLSSSSSLSLPSSNDPYPLLSFLFSGMKFMKNVAFKGRDIFIHYHKREEEILYSQFLFDVNGRVSESGNSILGKAREDLDDENVELPILDLSPFLDFYRQNVVYISSKEGDSTDSCGSLNKPCLNVNVGLDHLIEGEFSFLVVDDSFPCVEKEIEWMECNVKGKGESLVNILMNSSVSVVSSSSCLMKSEKNLNFVLVGFIFDSYFESSHSFFWFHDGEGELSFSSSSFKSDKEDSIIQINSSLFKINSRGFFLNNVSFSFLSFSSSSLLFSLSFLSSSIVETIILNNLHFELDGIDDKSMNSSFFLLNSSFISLVEGSLFSVSPPPPIDGEIEEEKVYFSLSSSSFKDIKSSSSLKPSFFFSSCSSVPLHFNSCVVESSFSSCSVGICLSISSSSFVSLFFFSSFSLFFFWWWFLFPFWSEWREI
jgi:hypothetical protein